MKFLTRRRALGLGVALCAALGATVVPQGRSEEPAPSQPIHGVWEAWNDSSGVVHVEFVRYLTPQEAASVSTQVSATRP